MFGTTDGQVIVMSSTGAMIRQFTVHEGNEITSMAWSCEKFNMEEAEARDGDSFNRDEGERFEVCFFFYFSAVTNTNTYPHFHF